MNTPTLLWFMPIEPDIGMEILALLGIVLNYNYEWNGNINFARYNVVLNYEWFVWSGSTSSLHCIT